MRRHVLIHRLDRAHQRPAAAEADREVRAQTQILIV